MVGTDQVRSAAVCGLLFAPGPGHCGPGRRRCDLALSLSWLELLRFGLIIVGVLGLLWSRARARTKGCSGDAACGSSTSDSGAGCGCTSTAVR